MFGCGAESGLRYSDRAGSITMSGSGSGDGSGPGAGSGAGPRDGPGSGCGSGYPVLGIGPG